MESKSMVEVEKGRERIDGTTWDGCVMMHGNMHGQKRRCGNVQQMVGHTQGAKKKEQ